MSQDAANSSSNEAFSVLPDEAQTLQGLFRARIQRTPDKVAYRYFDIASNRWIATTWAEMGNEVARWQAAFEKEDLKPGDRVGIMMRNSREWVVFDQAAMGLGLITVPIFSDDRPDNVAYIVNHADIRLLVVEGKRQWQRIQEVSEELQGVRRLVSVHTIEEEQEPEDPRLISLPDWIFGLRGELKTFETDPTSLATIVYTSGTTGRPKGVMLSHHNILLNAYSASECAKLRDDEVFLSFLPLSHMLERTGGYYMPIVIGAEVAFARSIPQLGEDLMTIKPTVLISVPRIYERVYAKIMDGLTQKSPLARKLFERAVEVGWRHFEYKQGRASWRPSLLEWPLLEKMVARKVAEKLGGRMRLAICGGAALSPTVSRVFIGLGITVLQGYGMTEASPVVSVNRVEDNVPASIGLPIPGFEVKIGENEELLARGPSVMLGYWQNEQATRETIDEEGWLHTGDKARIDEGGHVFITGRIKEIIVLANGEKVPPADMEMAITMDPLFEQVMVHGEARPFLTAIVTLNPEKWAAFAKELDVDPNDAKVFKEKFVEKSILQRLMHQLREFPGYAHIRRLTATLEPWTVDNGLLTHTLKVKRARVVKQFADDIERMYESRRA